MKIVAYAMICIALMSNRRVDGLGVFKKAGMRMGLFVTNLCTDDAKIEMVLDEVDRQVREAHDHKENQSLSEAEKISSAVYTGRVLLQALLPGVNSTVLENSLGDAHKASPAEINWRRFILKWQKYISKWLMALSILTLTAFSVFQAHFVRTDKKSKLPRLEILKVIATILLALSYIVSMFDLILLVCKIFVVEWWQIILIFGQYAPHFMILTTLVKQAHQYFLVAYLSYNDIEYEEELEDEDGNSNGVTNQLEVRSKDTEGANRTQQQSSGTKDNKDKKDTNTTKTQSIEHEGSQTKNNAKTDQSKRTQNNRPAYAQTIGSSKKKKAKLLDKLPLKPEQKSHFFKWSLYGLTVAIVGINLYRLWQLRWDLLGGAAEVSFGAITFALVAARFRML